MNYAPRLISADIPGHGTYQADASTFDWAMERYLPNSPARLREWVEQTTDRDFSDVTEASLLLLVLADVQQGRIDADWQEGR